MTTPTESSKTYRSSSGGEAGSVSSGAPRPAQAYAYMIVDTQRNIRDLRQWLCWRIEERDGKQTKVPYSPLTAEKASTTDPGTWASYSEAVEAYRSEEHTS